MNDEFSKKRTHLIIIEPVGEDGRTKRGSKSITLRGSKMTVEEIYNFLQDALKNLKV